MTATRPSAIPVGLLRLVAVSLFVLAIIVGGEPSWLWWRSMIAPGGCSCGCTEEVRPRDP